jgi:hypothetical protein
MAIEFPIIRRVFPNLIANDIISVQPMSLPSGLLFYMDYQYGKTTPYISKDFNFRTKNIRSWMYSDVDKKILRKLEDPLNLP